MSKIYEKYKSLKNSSENSANSLYLFKSGIFFLFVDKDAVLMSQILGLKLGNLNEEIVKCGFPVSSLPKYASLLENMGYHLEIVEMDQDEKRTSIDFRHEQQFQFLMEELLHTNIEQLSISEAYHLLTKLKNGFAEII